MIDESLAAHLHAAFGQGDDLALVGAHATNLYRHDAALPWIRTYWVSLDRRTMQEVCEMLAARGLGHSYHAGGRLAASGRPPAFWLS